MNNNLYELFILTRSCNFTETYSFSNLRDLEEFLTNLYDENKVYSCSGYIKDIDSSYIILDGTNTGYYNHITKHSYTKSSLNSFIENVGR